MANWRKKQWRAAWLQVHKWIGLTLAVLIIPISLTGSALVWHDWLNAKLDPPRYATIGPATLPYQTYVASARAALGPDERLSSLRLNDEGKPLVATATKAVAPGGSGRPP